MNRVRAWVRRLAGWSTSRRSWIERGAGLGLLVAAGGGVVVARHWSTAGQVMLAAGWLILLAVLLRREVIRLAGPVFLYELLRASRHWVHVKRVVYIAIILGVVSYSYFIQTSFGSPYAQGLRDQAELAHNLFLSYAGVQIGLVGLLTPLMVAGAIAEEKERRTLEFILATDLTSREIVLGKLAARITTMLTLLIAGLPVLALMQFMGGIDPGELLALTIVSVVTLYSFSTLGLMLSALLRRGRDAIVSTFILLGGYLLASAVSRELQYTSLASLSMSLGSVTIDFTDLLELFEAGNPLVSFGRVFQQMSFGNDHADVLREVVTNYTIFHLAIGSFFLIWAVMRLRPVMLAQAGESRGKGGRRLRGLPPIGASPMTWKEVYAEPGLRLHILVRIGIYLVVFASFLPAIYITLEHWGRISQFLETLPFSAFDLDSHDSLRRYQEQLSYWVRHMSAEVGSLLLVGVGVRAAGTVTGECARQTLDELLTTPLTNAEIIRGKWLGSVLGVRRAWLWLGTIFLIGILTGAINPLGVVLAVIVWWCYAVLVAAIGVWCSVVYRTTLQSTIATIVISVIALGGHWVIAALCCYIPLIAVNIGRGLDLLLIPIGVQTGLTPPAVLALAPMHSLKELLVLRDPEAWLFFGGVIAGPVIAVIVGLALRNNAVTRFAIRFHRTDHRRPEIIKRWE